MKTEILKLRIVVLLALLASTHHLPTKAMTHHQIQELDKNQFLELMVDHIKTDAVEAIIALIEHMIDKNNKEPFDAIIRGGERRLDLIQETTLTPLEQKLAIVRITEPNSQFHTILEKTYTLTNDMAYKELKGLIGVLRAHQASDQAKIGTALVGKLKPILKRLTSVETLNKLDQKVTEIYDLVAAYTTSAKVMTELNTLKQLIKELKVKSAATQQKVDISIVSIIGAMVKR